MVNNNGLFQATDVLDSQSSSSSQFSSHNTDSVKPSLDSVTNSSSNDTHFFNTSNSLENPGSSSLIIHDNLKSPAEDLYAISTQSKGKTGGNNKVQSELKLSSNETSVSSHHESQRKNAKDVTKTYIKSRKKKRRKFSSPMHTNNHRQSRRHHRKAKLQRRKSMDFDEFNESTKKTRAVQLLTRHPNFLGARNEQILLRFKRKSENDGDKPPQNHKKRKRKKRRQTLQRYANPRSLPRQNLFNNPVNGLTKAYPRGVMRRQPALTRNPNDFVTNSNAIFQAKYQKLMNRGKTSPLLWNPYRFPLKQNEYDWRKSFFYMNTPTPSRSAINAAQSRVQFAKKGNVQQASLPSGTRKFETESAWPMRFQDAAKAEQAQLAKYQYATKQPQILLNNNDLSRKQFIPTGQRAFYGYEPQPVISQITVADANKQIARFPQPGPIKPQFFPQERARVTDWSAVLPETKGHVIPADEAFRRSSGLVMYLNFEDVESGKAPYASFNGNVENAGKRTEISRSFGSCGKVARINNGSEILLNGAKIKVMRSCCFFFLEYRYRCSRTFLCDICRERPHLQ